MSDCFLAMASLRSLVLDHIGTSELSFGDSSSQPPFFGVGRGPGNSSEHRAAVVYLPASLTGRPIDLQPSLPHKAGEVTSALRRFASLALATTLPTLDSKAQLTMQGVTNPLSSSGGASTGAASIGGAPPPPPRHHDAPAAGTLVQPSVGSGSTTAPASATTGAGSGNALGQKAR